ncbi:LysE family translocator [Actinomadura sp. SCN-SB]|uniref:LysE family translocator n=1 Tax=Actinomadura sp. SCN-SB TaxID=3373092 RepID=UPI003752BEE9
MWTQMVAAAGVLALLTVLPGPDMAVVTQRAIARGRSDALRAMAGIVSGLLVWGLCAIAGLAAVLAASAEAYLVVKLLGAGYLVFLGARALWDNRRGSVPPEESRAGGAGGAYWTGLVTNALNPKIAVFYVGLLPALVPDGLPVAPGMALLVLLHAALSVAWLGGYAGLLARARSLVERPGVRRALGRATGVALIGFGVRVAADSG